MQIECNESHALQLLGLIAIAENQIVTDHPPLLDDLEFARMRLVFVKNRRKSGAYALVCEHFEEILHGNEAIMADSMRGG